MTRLRAVVVLSVAVALVALISGCPKPSGTTPPPTGGPGANTAAGQASAPAGGGPASAKWTIGMSQCNLAEPWRVQMNRDIEEAAKQHPEISVIFKDAQNKTEQQQAQVREFISQGVDLIIISPKEAVPLTAPVAEAMDAKIPVIVLDRKIQGDKYTCFIGGDNVLIGREAGKYMVKLLNGKGRVVELQGLKTSTPADERHRGFMEGIQGSQIDVIYSADCQWLEANAQREMNSALTRFDQIDAVYGHNDPSAHGAYMAAQQEGKGREKSIKFVGIDGLPHEGVQYVKDGILAATFEYPTGGATAITTALEILDGKSVPKTVTLGTRLYTPENVDKGGEAIAAPAAEK